MYTMCLWDYKSHKKTYEKKLKKEKKEKKHFYNIKPKVIINYNKI